MLSFLNEGGEMGARMRAHDWARTPLGPPEQWPQALRTAVGIMLSSKYPMFLAWGPQLTFLYNDGYIPILGEKHPALAMPFQELWNEIWDDISPIVDKALAGEATYWENLELEMHRHGRPEPAWFTFSYSPLRGELGEVLGMFCACTETTAQVLGKRRRIDDLGRLRRLFDRAPVFMAVVRGSDHRFELANESFLELSGHRELIGRTVREAFPELEPQGFLDRLDGVYRTGTPFTTRSERVRLEGPDGKAEDRVLDFVYEPMRDGADSAVFIAGYDVTERHRAEERLRESEERFRLIADSAPVPMWVSKLDRLRSFVNRAYLDFTGGDYEWALNLDWRNILHPDDHDRIVRQSIEGEASLKPFVLEARYRRGDGQWRWLRSTSQPRWGPDGELAGFIGVAHDVTEAKEAERALRELNETLERRVAARTADLSAALDRLQQEVAERERAEEALRQAQKMEAVGRLTGGIAHDFNNLLTPIIGGLELITRRLEDPRLQRLAQGALDSGRRGAKLATQLLTFSRLQRISMAPVPVNRVIDEMQGILRHSIGSRINVISELGDEVGYALSDANQLENAILNLAINARDAMPDGGRLTISTGLRQEPEGPDLAAGDYVCITVADTGEGMPPEVLARAMEPFFSTKEVGKGTGLGLPQVYGTAQQSGGTVRLESKAGAGTKVHILLPHVPAARLAGGLAGSGENEAEPPRGPSLRIMVVDDDREVRAFLADTLEELGHRVEACDCAETGLNRIDSCDPHLVLADFAMPGMNGAEFARRVRALRPQQPIVFVTGYAESEQLESVLGGDVPTLRKPFTVAELMLVIDDQADPPTS